MKHTLQRLFPTLRRKVGLAIAIVILVGGGGFVYVAYTTGSLMLVDQTRLKARGTVDVVNSLVEEALVAGDSLRLQQVLNAVSLSQSVRNAFLVGPDGKIKYQSRGSGLLSPESRRMVDGMYRTGAERFTTSREHDTTVAYFLAPLRVKPQCVTCHAGQDPDLGYFGIRLSTEDVRTLAKEHRAANIALTVAIFGGFGAIMFGALLLLVIRPIGRLHSHIRTIEGTVGKLEAGTAPAFPLLEETYERDEVADLCRDFNNLVSRLNEANQRIFELHNSQLAQADRLSTAGEIAAGMAHEIKNPVAGVLGALQVIESDLAPGDQRHEIFQEMRAQLERVVHALNDLLTYARPTPPVFEEVDITEVIDKTRSILSVQFNGKAIDLRVAHAARPEKLVADRKQLQQLFWNLMLNAVQAVDPPGSVDVRTEHTATDVTVSVADTGKGISPEDIERVFKPFYTTKHKGTGLGMTISRRIVEMHHGTIAIASAVGRGTTVRVTIPVRQDKA